jgi:hypothetical protein
VRRMGMRLQPPHPPSRGERQQDARQRSLSDYTEAAPVPLPSAALVAAMSRCGSGHVDHSMLQVQHEGHRVQVRAIVPRSSPSSGTAILRAVGTDMDCFTPELREELQQFVELSDRPSLSYAIIAAPSPPPPLTPPPPPPPDAQHFL